LEYYGIPNEVITRNMGGIWKCYDEMLSENAEYAAVFL